MDNTVKLIYVMDPHCGWCFGFGKVILALFEGYKNNPSIQFDIRLGGLFYPAIKTGSEFAKEKQPIANRIEALAKVKFAKSYFTHVLGPGNYLDSEPPARAILTIKAMQPELLVPFTERLLEKEFMQGKNCSFDKTIFETVDEFKIDLDKFTALFCSPTQKQKTVTEFQETRSMVNGYPVLFIQDKDQLTKLAGGYAPLARLEHKINALLLQRH